MSHATKRWDQDLSSTIFWALNRVSSSSPRERSDPSGAIDPAGDADRAKKLRSTSPFRSTTSGAAASAAAESAGAARAVCGTGGRGRVDGAGLTTTAERREARSVARTDADATAACRTTMCTPAVIAWFRAFAKVPLTTTIIPSLLHETAAEITAASACAVNQAAAPGRRDRLGTPLAGGGRRTGCTRVVSGDGRTEGRYGVRGEEHSWKSGGGTYAGHGAIARSGVAGSWRGLGNWGIEGGLTVVDGYGGRCGG